MKIENEFMVNAPVQQAWGAMLDLERIAPCLPGASIDEATDDEEYQGTMAIKLGPISARYRGTVSVEEADEENHRAVMKANGQETRGQGSASATITSTLYEENGSTRVHVETDMQVAGRVAQFGRGIMQDVAEELMDRFSTCVEQEIGGGGAGEEPEQPAEERPEQAAEAETSKQKADSTERGESVKGRQEGQRTRKYSPREAEPLDLGGISRAALIKRVTPVIVGLGGLGLATVLIRLLARPSFSIRFEILKR